MTGGDTVTGEREPLSDRDVIALYRTMATIRGFEDRVSRLYADGAIPGFVHVSLGQEAVAAGVCWPLDDKDVITTTHRGHGHCLAKGLDLETMFAELMAKETGTNLGRAGSMHLCDPRIGIFGANGIVGAGLPIAVGAGLAARMRGEGSIAVAFFGDGAVAQGAFHESLNLAALWRLPVVFVCENNKYAEFSPIETQHPVRIADRALGYGMRYVGVDGNDVLAVAEAMVDVVVGVRSGEGPVLLEADTYRWHGHYEGDPQRYRTTDEREEWQRDRDPIVRLTAEAAKWSIASAVLEEIDGEIEAQLARAIEWAMSGSQPPVSSLHDYVVADRPTIPEPQAPTGEANYRYMDAVRDGLHAALTNDPDVFIAGIDVAAGGNVFGITRDLADEWPDRVFDTPISETAVVGVAVGAAMAGFRPVIEIMYLDFIAVCFDQIINQAAKLRFMTGGAAELPLVIRTQFGAGRSSGSQHSQSLEALLAHIPGLTVVMPSTPADAYGLLRAAIADPNPVVFIENRHLYGLRGPQPPADHLVPIGKAKIVRPGRDITVVSVSRMVHEALAAAEELAAEGIDVEVIDLRTVSPLDTATVLESVVRTSRLLIAHEAVADFGIGAEVAAVVAADAFWALDAPIARVGAPATPPPYAPDLERVWLPDRRRIADAIRTTTRA